jgi:two-component system, sensor histidine kinase
MDACSVQETQGMARRDTLSPGRNHVLIVDDHAGSRALCAGYLDLFDHTSESVGDVGEALEALRRGPFGAVVMNLHMAPSEGAPSEGAPGEGALETLGAIRALPGSAAATPIIGLTAVGRGDEAQRWLAAGLAAVLAKPVTAAGLFAALGVALTGDEDGSRSWAPTS